jgi:hypothetical protein
VIDLRAREGPIGACNVLELVAQLICMTLVNFTSNLTSRFTQYRAGSDKNLPPRKHRSSSCLDSNFQSKILGKPWQKICGSHISEKQAKSAKPQGKQTAQAFVATTPNTNSSTTTKPHDGKYTSPKVDNNSPGSKKIEIRPTVNSNNATAISNDATVYIKYSQKKAIKVQKNVAQSCDRTETRTRVTSFEDYRYRYG